jgi:hypothetical protein
VTAPKQTHDGAALAAPFFGALFPSVPAFLMHGLDSGANWGHSDPACNHRKTLMTLPVAPFTFVPVVFVLILFQGALAVDYLNQRLALGFDLPSLAAVFEEGARWVGWAWATAVWAGIAGAALLAWRDGGAVLVLFVAALAALLCILGAAFTDHAPLVDFLGVPWPAVAAALFGVPFLGWTYARSLRKRALLR